MLFTKSSVDERPRSPVEIFLPASVKLSPTFNVRSLPSGVSEPIRVMFSGVRSLGLDSTTSYFDLFVSLEASFSALFCVSDFLPV